MASKNRSTKSSVQLRHSQAAAGVLRLRRVLELVERFDPASVRNQYEAPGLDALTIEIDDALIRTFGADTPNYERYKQATHFDRGPFRYAGHALADEFQASIARSKATNIALLNRAIKSLEQQIK